MFESTTPFMFANSRSVTFYLIYHLGREYAPRSCWIGSLSTYTPRCQSFSLVRCKASSPDPRSTWKIGCYYSMYSLYTYVQRYIVVAVVCWILMIKNFKNVLRIRNLFGDGVRCILQLYCVNLRVSEMCGDDINILRDAQPTYKHWIKSCMLIQIINPVRVMRAQIAFEY